MSCIGFWTESQRERLKAAALDSRPVSRFLSPKITAGKLLRLRLMAADPNPKLRQSAALNASTPPDVLDQLARDDDPGVRICVARHHRCPETILRDLAADPNEDVRSWVAGNPATPDDVLTTLSSDPAATVRRLADWAGTTQRLEGTP